MTNKQRVSAGMALTSAAFSVGSTFATTAAWKVGLLAVGGILLGAATVMFFLMFKQGGDGK